MSVSLEARSPGAPSGTQAGMPLARFRAEALAALRRSWLGIDGGSAWRPPPWGFVPEDVPNTLAAQQRWFGTMKGLLVNTWDAPNPKSKAQLAFMRWLSARAAEPLPLGWTPEALLFSVLSRGAVLPRSLPVQRLVDKLDAWERATWEENHRVEMESEAEAYRCAFPYEPFEDLDVVKEPPWPVRLLSLAARPRDRVVGAAGENPRPGPDRGHPSASRRGVPVLRRAKHDLPLAAQLGSGPPLPFPPTQAGAPGGDARTVFPRGARGTAEDRALRPGASTRLASRRGSRLHRTNVMASRRQRLPARRSPSARESTEAFIVFMRGE